MAQNGTNYLVLVQTGTSNGAPVFTSVGEQRDCSTEFSTAEIDTSTKESGDQTVMGGLNSATLTLDALDSPSDAAQQALRAAQEAKSLIMIVQHRSGSPVRKANFLITSITENAPQHDVVTFNCSFTRSGSWQNLS